jgi:hypothetical protein
MDYIEIVRDLNIELFEQGDTENGFNYSTTGFVDIIEFNGVLLWSSEMDDREFDELTDDYEPLLPYIKKTFNQHITNLKTLKL